MSAVEREARSSPGCIDEESLAAYVDGRLDPAERRAVELHAAQCSRCRTLLVETAAFVKDDARTGNVPRFRVTWKETLLAAALAAGVVLLVRITFLSSRQAATASRPELAGLVAAAANEPTRLVEGRLTGGFAYKPPPVPTRGAGDRNISPELKIAAAQIEQTMRGKDTAEAAAALGDSYLAVGDFDRAVEYLESAVDEKPDDPRYQNDLAAAYIARASTTGRAEDWPKAYAAAERAAKRNSQLVEPCFNKALALEGLNLASAAADAWSICGRADRGSDWAAEALKRSEDIRKRLRTSSGETNQQKREAIEDRLFVRWAHAEAAGDVFNADSVLATAEAAAQALARAGGDTMALDEVALIRNTKRASRERTALVNAHVAYGRAREALTHDRLTDASREMSAAAVLFAAAGSAYKDWAAIFRAIPAWIDGEPQQALLALASVPFDHIPTSYYHLKGRIAWTRGVALQIAGRYDVARTAFTDAHDLFSRAGEVEYAAVNASYLATIDRFLGSRPLVWRESLEALREIDRLPSSPRRNAILWLAALSALDENLPETALALQQYPFRLFDAEHPGEGGPDDPSAYLRRGQIYGRLGDKAAAFADFSRADALAMRMPESRLRDRMTNEVRQAEAEFSAFDNPEAAIAAVDTALEFHRRLHSAVSVSELLLIRAHADEARGDIQATARDYEEAIAESERDQDLVRVPELRKAAFEQQRAVVRDAVRFTALIRRDPMSALRIEEQARARVLREALARRSTPALDPAIACRYLPENVGVIYLVTLDDQVLGWVLTTTGTTHFSVPAGSAAHGRLLHRIERRIAANASFADLLSDLEPLKAIYAPALRALAPHSTIVIIADGALARLPIAAFPDAHDAPLVATHAVLVAPSFTTFMLASRRLRTFRPDDVLAVGDGHDPVSSGLPLLPHANSEAKILAQLYPQAAVLVGSMATRANVLKELSGQHSVVHLASHIIANTEFPFLSRLLFAPAPETGDSGVLFATEIGASQFTHIGVVVLAGCESAAGNLLPEEGINSVARMFLDSGVPSVVASLWPLSDDSTHLLVAFHRQLRISRDATRALRLAQLATFGEAIGRVPIRRWAGLIAIGGLDGIPPRR